MAYFNPSDIRSVRAVIQNIASSGFGFAASEGGELIFVPHRLVEQFRLDAGDQIVAFCVPSEQSDSRNERQMVAGLRAIRLTVEKSLRDFSEVASPPKQTLPVITPVSVSKKEMTPDTIREMVPDIISEPRAWTTAQVRSEIIRRCADTHVIKDDMTNAISNALHSLHGCGEASMCRVFGNSSQSTPSLVYWARSTQIFGSLIDDMEVS